MNRTQWVFRIVAAGLATVIVTAGTVAAVKGGMDQLASGSMVPIGWISIPLGLVVLWLVTLLLLGVDRKVDEGHDGFVSQNCPNCDREILGEWRMCPYCGSRLETLEHEGGV